MRVVAAFTVSSFLLGACGPSWPGSVTSLHATPTEHAVKTVDVLPLDLEMWAEPGYDANLEEVRGPAEARITDAALDALSSRAYTPNVLIDWNGEAAGSAVMPKDALLATIGSLARYGTSSRIIQGQLPPPYLPAHLGDATHGDATLYIGGWSYLALPHQTDAEEVVKDIFIGLAIVATIALVVAIASSSKGSHGHGGGGGGSHGGGGGGGGGGHVAVRHWHAPSGGDHAIADGIVNLADALGHIPTPAEVDHPDFEDDPRLPHEGGESRMYLEMTLVDNHTGRALWHAHQTFPANGAAPAEVARAADALLATMPQS